MKRLIKDAVKRGLAALVIILDKTRMGRYFYSEMLHGAMTRTKMVRHDGIELLFSIPNALNTYRADTFSTKEPETLEWINSIPEDSVVWDIGANVGLYTCYAAKRRNCRVFAFEPSVFNLELLARNLYINKLTDQVTIVPLPLSESLSMSTLNMTTTEWGGALSTFGQAYGHDGQPMIDTSSQKDEIPSNFSQQYGHLKVFDFPTVGISMDEAVATLAIPLPDYIKMDVDGIEHLILKGGASALNHVQGALIEINDNFTAQAEDASIYLQKAGLTLKEKRHAEEFNVGVAKYTFNQIWER